MSLGICLTLNDNKISECMKTQKMTRKTLKQEDKERERSEHEKSLKERMTWPYMYMRT